MVARNNLLEAPPYAVEQALTMTPRDFLKSNERNGSPKFSPDTMSKSNSQTKEKTMNYVEMEKLRKRILKYPNQYNQNFWGFGKDSNTVKDQKPACKTAGCMAYNVVVGHGYRLVFEGDFNETDFCAKKGTGMVAIRSVATDILDLTPVQADELFYASGAKWSDRAHEAYRNASGPKGRAAAAAMAIEDFVAKWRAIEAYGTSLIRALEA